jgi:hypothetical protein
MAELMGIAKFERLFRETAGVDVDKSDLRRVNDFINQKIYDLLLMAQAAAKVNIRDMIEPWDIPITKGLQECMNEFRALEPNLELQPILEQLAPLPTMDLGYSDGTQHTLPILAGGLAIALVKTFKILDPDLENPQTQHWEQAFGLFNLLL